MEKRSYKYGESYLHLIFGDLATSDAEVLVSSDDRQLTMGGGVSAALLRRAGEALLIDAAKKAPATLGDVVVTTAGALPAQYIFHVITIGPGGEQLNNKQVIERGTRKCLDLLVTLGLREIAFPSIGAGSAGFSYEDVSIKMAEVIATFLKERDEAFHISIYLYDRYRRMTPIDFIGFFEQFAARLGKQPEPISKEDIKIPSKRESAEDTRITTTKRLSELSQERDAIEARIAETRDFIEKSTIKELEHRLDAIHKERLQLLDQLRQPVDEGVRVFISYSHKDEEYRKQLKSHLKALERIGLITNWHDRMITAGSEWEGKIDENLNQAGVILLLISNSFIDSKYCFDVELKQALQRHENGESLVIPVIIRPVIWSDLPFAKLQVLPTEGKAVNTWSNIDLAWVNVAEGVKTAVQDFLARKKPY